SQRQQELLNSVYYFRITIGPFVPPLDQLRRMVVWWEYKGELMTTQPDVRANFWSDFGWIMAFGKVLAVVIQPAQSDNYETIYPIQDSVILTEMSTILVAQLDGALLERLSKLPQETFFPDLWALLTEALAKHERTTFFHYKG